MGAKKKPFYRIVVADRRSPRNGRFIETIGTYDPLTQPETVVLEHERAAHWLSEGAQPSDAVSRLLKGVNLLDEAGKPVPFDPASVAVADVENGAEPAADEGEESDGGLVSTATEAVTDIVEDVKEVVSNVVAEAGDAVTNMVDTITDTIDDASAETTEDVEDAAEDDTKDDE